MCGKQIVGGEGGQVGAFIDVSYRVQLFILTLLAHFHL